MGIPSSTHDARGRLRGIGVRLLAVVVTAAAVVTLLGGPADAEEVPVSGSFTAEGYFQFQCAFAQEFLTGGGDWTGLGAVSLDFEFCVDIPAVFTDPWPITRGTFTITAPDGTLTGDIGGYVMAASPDPNGLFPGQMTWTVTGGTGRFARAEGELVLDTLSEYVEPTNRRMTGTVAGTISVPPPTPTSKDDCKDGGWRNVADENGNPFANQGECIAWVNQNT